MPWGAQHIGPPRRGVNHTVNQNVVTIKSKRVKKERKENLSLKIRKKVKKYCLTIKFQI
jgi:hypothetical protein